MSAYTHIVKHAQNLRRQNVLKEIIFVSRYYALVTRTPT